MFGARWKEWHKRYHEMEKERDKLLALIMHSAESVSEELDKLNDSKSKNEIKEEIHYMLGRAEFIVEEPTWKAMLGALKTILS